MLDQRCSQCIEIFKRLSVSDFPERLILRKALFECHMIRTVSFHTLVHHVLKVRNRMAHLVHNVRIVHSINACDKLLSPL